MTNSNVNIEKSIKEKEIKEIEELMTSVEKDTKEFEERVNPEVDPIPVNHADYDNIVETIKKLNHLLKDESVEEKHSSIKKTLKEVNDTLKRINVERIEYLIKDAEQKATPNADPSYDKKSDELRETIKELNRLVKNDSAEEKHSSIIETRKKVDDALKKIKVRKIEYLIERVEKDAENFEKGVTPNEDPTLNNNYEKILDQIKELNRSVKDDSVKEEHSSIKKTLKKVDDTLKSIKVNRIGYLMESVEKDAEKFEKKAIENFKNIRKMAILNDSLFPPYNKEYDEILEKIKELDRLFEDDSVKEKRDSITKTLEKVDSSVDIACQSIDIDIVKKIKEKRIEYLMESVEKDVKKFQDVVFKSKNPPPYDDKTCEKIIKNINALDLFLEDDTVKEKHSSILETLHKANRSAASAFNKIDLQRKIGDTREGKEKEECDIFLMPSEKEKLPSDDTHLRLYHDNGKLKYYLDDKGSKTEYTIDAKELNNVNLNDLFSKYPMTEEVYRAILTTTSSRGHTQSYFPLQEEKTNSSWKLNSRFKNLSPSEEDLCDALENIEYLHEHDKEDENKVIIPDGRWAIKISDEKEVKFKWEGKVFEGKEAKEKLDELLKSKVLEGKEVADKELDELGKEILGQYDPYLKSKNKQDEVGSESGKAERSFAKLNEKIRAEKSKTSTEQSTIDKTNATPRRTFGK